MDVCVDAYADADSSRVIEPPAPNKDQAMRGVCKELIWASFSGGGGGGGVMAGSGIVLYDNRALQTDRGGTTICSPKYVPT